MATSFGLHLGGAAHPVNESTVTLFALSTDAISLLLQDLCAPSPSAEVIH